jgi:HEAT repeat protein
MVFAFLLSMFMTSNLYKSYGVRISLLLYPLVLLLCFLGIGIAANLITAIVIKGSDKSLSYSINRSARELLFIPISADIKYKAIVFIDMFVDRFSKGIGAFVLLIILSFGFDDYRELVRIVSFVSVALILGWIVFTLRASKEYLKLIKDNLIPPEPRPDVSVEAQVDKDFMKLIFDTLESRERSPDLFAMHVYELMRKGKLSPELRQMLVEPEEDAGPLSFGALLGGDPSAFIPMSGIDDNSADLKQQIQDILSLDVYENVMQEFINKALSDKSAITETRRMEIAKGIGFLSPNSPVTHKLGDLLLDSSLEVRKYAIESAAKIRKREYVPNLIQSLGDFRIKSDASAALEKYGPRITGILADYLCDQEENTALRKAVVPILAHIGNQEAVDYILWELDKEKGEMDTELIDALDRIRSEKSDIDFTIEIIKKKIKQEILTAYVLFEKFHDAESKGEDPKVCGIVSHDLNITMGNIFKLLGLIFPYDDVIKACQNIQKGTKKSVAYAVELLDNILEKEIREAILPIVEDLSQEDRVKACRALRKDFPEF